MSQTAKARLSALFFYGCVAVLCTWPLAAHITTAIPGTEGDNFLFVWNQWHIFDSLRHLNNPYLTTSIAFPFESNLVFHTLAIVTGSFSALLQFFLPLTLAFNIILLLSLVAAAFGTYMLVEYLFQSRAAAFVAGLIFAFNAYIFQEILGHFQYTSIFFIPWFLFFLFKALREASSPYGALAGLVLALSLYNEFYYTVGLGLLALCLLLWQVMYNRKDFIRAKEALIVLALTVFILGSPLVIASIKTLRDNALPVPRPEQVALYSPDIRSFFIPSTQQAVYGNSFKAYYAQVGYHASVIYISYTLFALALLGFFATKKPSRQQRNVWLLNATLFLLVTLGPVAYVARPLFPLPYMLATHIPLINNILVTPRFIIFVILALIVLAAPGIKMLYERCSSRLLGTLFLIGVCSLYIFEVMPLPLPLSSTKIPALYYELAKDSEGYTILELPFALSTSFYTLGNGTSPSKTQYYQTAHHKKLLSAWISRVPDTYYSFYASIAGLNYLIAPDKPLPEASAASLAAQAKKNFATLHIRYIIVHPEYYSHDQLTHTITFLNQTYKQDPEFKEGMLIYDLRRQ